MQATIVRAAAYFSYTPLLGLAAVVTFAKLFVYASLVEVAQFGLLGKMLLISSVFGLVGNLGLQSVASRDLPALIARGRVRRAMRLLAQTVGVTTAAGLLGALAVFAGLSLFDMSAPELLLGLAHGWAQSIFLTTTYESRSRLQMMRYARDTTLRSIVVALAGSATGVAYGDAAAIIAAETACTLASFLIVAGAASRRARARGAWSLQAMVSHLRSLPWRAALVLLCGALVVFASANLDRWIAAESLARETFGQYSFAWIALLAAQSMQALLNSGLQPLLAHRRAVGKEGSAYRLTATVSLSLLIGGLVLCGPLAWLSASMIERWLPQYVGAIALLLPLFLAAVLRLSDFWTSLLVVVNREGLVLAAQLVAMAFAAALYAAWLLATGSLPAPSSLGWFALATALLSHLASAACAVACARPQRNAKRDDA